MGDEVPMSPTSASGYRNGIPNTANSAVYSTMGEGFAVRHAVETASPAPPVPEYNPEDHPENNDPKFPSIIKRGFPTEFQDRDAAFAYMESRLEMGIDINSVDRYGNSAVHYNYEHPEVITWLTNHGADINAQNKEGWTALHMACDDYTDKYKAALFLVEHGADPNHQGIHGRTPMHLACYKHFKSGQSRAMLVKMLLSNGGDPNIEWEEGTPLHACVAPSCSEKDLNEPELMAALIRANANVNVRAQNDGNTPLQRLVQMDGHGLDPEAAVAVATYLISMKADYTSPCGDGVPPKRAARSGPMRDFFKNKK